jgi:hypothetical protein
MEYSPRGHKDDALIKEYVRRLKNNETPPPIEVHRGSNIIFAGDLRFYAYRAFYGNGSDEKVQVIWRDDIPDPRTDPDAFRLAKACADDNRNHGQRLSRGEKQDAIRKYLKTHSEDEARQYAFLLNETEDSFNELLSRFTRPSDDVLRKLVDDARKEREEKARGTTVQATIPEVKEALAPLTSVVLPPAREVRPESYTVGSLRSVSPLVKLACKQVRDAVQRRLSDMTEAEREELRSLATFLHSVVGTTYEQSAD